MNDVSAAVMDDLEALMMLEAVFPEDQRWSENSWRDELTGTQRHVLVCRGGAGLNAVASFSLSGDVVDLHRVITSATARRRGLARQLVDSGIAWGREVGASRMMLEVEADNTAALSLYNSAGFHRISERRDYYGPDAHAAILERAIPTDAEGETS